MKQHSDENSKTKEGQILSNAKNIHGVPLDAVLECRLKKKNGKKSFRDYRSALSLGVQLAQLRRDVGLSQADLAGRVGTQKQNISRLERRMCGSCTVATLTKIAQALDATLVVSFERNSLSKAESPRTEAPRDANMYN